MALVNTVKDGVKTTTNTKTGEKTSGSVYGSDKPKGGGKITYEKKNKENIEAKKEYEKKYGTRPTTTTEVKTARQLLAKKRSAEATRKTEEQLIREGYKYNQSANVWEAPAEAPQGARISKAEIDNILSGYERDARGRVIVYAEDGGRRSYDPAFAAEILKSQGAFALSYSPETRFASDVSGLAEDNYVQYKETPDGGFELYLTDIGEQNRGFVLETLNRTSSKAGWEMNVEGKRITFSTNPTKDYFKEEPTGISFSPETGEATVEFTGGRSKKYSDLTPKEKEGFDIYYSSSLKDLEAQVNKSIYEQTQASFDTGLKFKKVGGTWKLTGIEKYQDKTSGVQSPFGAGEFNPLKTPKKIRFEESGGKMVPTYGGKPYSELSKEQKEVVDRTLEQYQTSKDYMKDLATVEKITGSKDVGLVKVGGKWEFKNVKAWGYALGVQETYGTPTKRDLALASPTGEGLPLGERMSFGYNPRASPDLFASFSLRVSEFGHFVNKQLAGVGITKLSSEEAKAVDYKIKMEKIRLVKEGIDYREKPSLEKTLLAGGEAFVLSVGILQPLGSGVLGKGATVGTGAGVAAASTETAIPRLTVEAAKWAPQVKTFLVGGSVVATIGESQRILSIPEYKAMQEPEQVAADFIAGGVSSVAFSNIRVGLNPYLVRYSPELGLAGAAIESGGRIVAAGTAGGASGAIFSGTRDVLVGKEVDVAKAQEYALYGAAIGVGVETVGIAFEKGLIPKPVYGKVEYVDVATGTKHGYSGLGVEFMKKAKPLIGLKDWKPVVGTPNLFERSLVAYPMPQTPLETAIMKPTLYKYSDYLGQLTPEEQILAQREIYSFASGYGGDKELIVSYLNPEGGGLGVVGTRFRSGVEMMDFAYFSKDPTKLKLSMREMISEVELFKRKGATDQIMKVLREEKAGIEIFGSGSQRMYGALDRAAHDVDIKILSTKSPSDLASKMVKNLKGVYGSDIRVSPSNPSLVEIKMGTNWVHAFDIKGGMGEVVVSGESVLSADYAGYGLPVKSPFITEEGFLIMQLSEQGGRKFASALTPRSFGFSPEAHRLKDVMDALRVAEFKATAQGRADILASVKEFKSTIPPKVLAEFNVAGGSSYMISPAKYYPQAITSSGYAIGAVPLGGLFSPDIEVLQETISPKISPRPSPKISPKVSPPASPKISPKISPRPSPRTYRSPPYRPETIMRTKEEPILKPQEKLSTKKKKKERKEKLPQLKLSGVRSMYADLLSAARSQFKYGKATSPSLVKRPELWKYDRPKGGLPTVEELREREKSKKLKKNTKSRFELRGKKKRWF